MFTEWITIVWNNYAGLINAHEFSLFISRFQLAKLIVSVIVLVEALVVSSCDVRYFRPGTLFYFGVLAWVSLWLAIRSWFQNQNRSHSESIVCARHQVCYNAFVSLSFVDLSELFGVVDFHSNAILEYVLELAFLGLSLVSWKVLRMWPSHLDCCWSLSNMSEDSLL